MRSTVWFLIQNYRIIPIGRKEEFSHDMAIQLTTGDVISYPMIDRFAKRL
jgi:hypothetical protein